MGGQILMVVGILLVGLVVLGATMVLGMRGKSPAVLGVVRAVSRALGARQLRSSGKPGSFASIIRHRGRNSGKAYSTPVGIVPNGDGFLIALPYGTRSHWLRNVLAGGSATIVSEGYVYAVDRPELVPTAAVAHCFALADQRLFRLLRVDQCLSLARVEGLTPVAFVEAERALALAS